MVQLNTIDELCPDDLWHCMIELDRALTPRFAAMPNPTPSLSTCPVCEHRELVTFTQKHGLRIDRCDACDFRFTNPPPSAEQRWLFYNSEIKVLENLVFDRTRPVPLPIFQRRVELIRRYVARSKLHDIGGAVGSL